MADKKRSHVEWTIEEQLLLARSYNKNRCNWPAILADMKVKMDKLPEKTQAMYREAAYDKLKRRMSEKISKLSKSPETIQNEELRHLIIDIAANDKRYSMKGHPNDKRPKKHKLNPPPAAEDVVDNIPEVIPDNRHVVDNIAEVIPDHRHVPEVIPDHRNAAIPVNIDAAHLVVPEVRNEQQVAANNVAAGAEDIEGPTPPKKKPLTDLARETYERHNAMLERMTPMEDMMKRCMNKYLNS